jgi:lysophospholipase L1-like esterase
MATAILAAMLLAAKLAASLVILPLGDSITEGVPTADGYRRDLAALLAESGTTVRYVGSLSSRAGAHEGWTGFTAGELVPKLRATLERTRPDVVLLHIGTNDLGLGVPMDESIGHVRELLALIEARSRRDGGRPAIRVLLAQIIERNLFFGRGNDPEVAAYNARLAALAAERRKAGHKIEVVDMSAALDARRDLHDPLHPSAEGYRKMARAWAAALRRP